jgi:hydroxyacylglutathione hydrolase
MRITPVACLHDNYAYLVAEDGAAVVIDPSEAQPVEAALAREGWTLGAVLATHHHLDHVGGIADLLRTREGLEVVAYHGDARRIEHVTRPVQDGERIELHGLTFRALHIPAHTSGAIGWVLEREAKPYAVFTGDTLFVAGCGRLFEGTPADMFHSLVEVLGSLPDDVLVYCGHEYTEANLRFARHVEPENADVQRAHARAQEARASGKPTVPSSLGEERKVNPFLRSHVRAVRAFAAAGPEVSDVEVLGRVRRAKDAFR